MGFAFVFIGGILVFGAFVAGINYLCHGSIADCRDHAGHR